MYNNTKKARTMKKPMPDNSMFGVLYDSRIKPIPGLSYSFGKASKNLLTLTIRPFHFGVGGFAFKDELVTNIFASI